MDCRAHRSSGESQAEAEKFLREIMEGPLKRRASAVDDRASERLEARRD